MFCLNSKRIDSEALIYALLIRKTARWPLLELILFCYCSKRSGGQSSLASFPLVRKKYSVREVAMANNPSYASNSDPPTL